MKRRWVYRTLAIGAGSVLLILNIVYWPLNIKTNALSTRVSIGLLVVTAVSVAGLIAEWSEEQRSRREASEGGGQDAYPEEGSSAA